MQNKENAHLSKLLFRQCENRQKILYFPLDSQIQIYYKLQLYHHILSLRLSQI